MPIDLAGAVNGWQVALPAITALCAAFVVMLADLAMRGTERDGVAVVGVLGLGATMPWRWAVGRAGRVGRFTTRSAPIRSRSSSRWSSASARRSRLMSIDYLRENPLAGGDYYALVLLSTCGMILMAAANDLIVIFLALEIMSVAVYVLAGMLVADRRSNEAAVKYFFLGAFASGFLLYGTAFVFGATGSTQLDAIGHAVAKAPENPLLHLGLVLLSRLRLQVAMVRSGWAPTSARAPTRSPPSWRSG